MDEAKPELVLVDVRMPGLGGVETARALSARDPELVVVLVSLDDPPADPGAETIPFARKQDFGPRPPARPVGRARFAAPPSDALASCPSRFESY